MLVKESDHASLTVVQFHIQATFEVLSFYPQADPVSVQQFDMLRKLFSRSRRALGLKLGFQQDWTGSQVLVKESSK